MIQWSPRTVEDPVHNGAMEVALDETAFDLVISTVKSVDFYLQILAIALTAACAWSVSKIIRRQLDKLAGQGEEEGSSGPIRSRVGAPTYHLRELTFPITNAILLGIAVVVSREFFSQQWLVQLAQGINLLLATYIVATRISTSATIRRFALLVLVPLILVYSAGFLDDLIAILDGIKFSLGNIEFTLYAIARTALFGSILFWFGRLSNRKGSEFIRNHDSITGSTKELILKSFQFGLFVLVSLMILQIAGIDLTALVVFGGAIGVGLGFGLQQIAANFISGIIILIDRSIAIGDYIQLEDGRGGTLRELNMRSAILETYDGKDIVVPNEKFISTAFNNWSHNNQKQRYPIVFEVAYGTDLEKLFQILREVVSSHPMVLSGEDLPFEERPDAEIQAFNDSGVEILVEFWMEGIDDGKNRVGGDLLFMIYKALQENDIEIPFPQRVETIKEDQRPPPRRRGSAQPSENRR